MILIPWILLFMREFQTFIELKLKPEIEKLLRLAKNKKNNNKKEIRNCFKKCKSKKGTDCWKNKKNNRKEYNNKKNKKRIKTKSKVKLRNSQPKPKADPKWRLKNSKNCWLI